MTTERLRTIQRQKARASTLCKEAANEIERLQTELVACQAQNEKLRKALKYVIDDLELRAKLSDDPDERDIVAIGHGAYVQADEALSIPADHTTLRKREAEVIRRSAADLDQLEAEWLFELANEVEAGRIL